MGWNFGCAIITFDFHSVVDKLLEPERRQFVMGDETPEEARSKGLIGTATFSLVSCEQYGGYCQTTEGVDMLLEKLAP